MCGNDQIQCLFKVVRFKIYLSGLTSKALKSIICRLEKKSFNVIQMFKALPKKKNKKKQDEDIHISRIKHISEHKITFTPVYTKLQI